MHRRSLLAAAMAGMASPALAQTQTQANPENTIFLDLKDGRVVIQLLPEIAPLHVERIKTLTRQGFYDGIVFHRVIEGFMAQTGDPTGTGRGGSKLGHVKAEFTRNRRFLRGTVGAARAQDPNSADSQFFIMFAPGPFLDGQYTIWGQVTSGMEFVDRIARGEPPRTPDRIVRMRVAADVRS